MNKNKDYLTKFFSPEVKNFKSPYALYEKINPYATVRDKRNI